MPVNKRVLFILIFISTFILSEGQQTPLYPTSYRIFSPFIFNPAIAGSKDFTSVDFISGWLGRSNSQILSINSRLITNSPGYVMSPQIKKFSAFGFGGYMFNERNNSSQNIGISGACSYQIPIDQLSLSYFSFGIAAKGVFNIMDSITSPDAGLSTPEKKIFYPNLDFGVYYYGPKLFAGISAINILGNPEDPDSLGVYRIPVSRRYLFIAGYKILLNKSLDLVLEPSVIINSDGSMTQKLTDFLHPMLKFYMQGFCLGTYLNNYDNVSFFFQYKYPRFYLGTFVEIPRNSPYYKKPLNVELTLGINYSPIKSSNQKNYTW